jgi:hypothetical protein
MIAVDCGDYRLHRDTARPASNFHKPRGYVHNGVIDFPSASDMDPWEKRKYGDNVISGPDILRFRHRARFCLSGSEIGGRIRQGGGREWLTLDKRAFR